MAKKHKKTLEEKAAVAKQKKQQRRARRKKETRDNLAKEDILQDDRFFFIAGYTSGGAPHGVTWEEMGLKLWNEYLNCGFCIFQIAISILILDRIIVLKEVLRWT